MTLHTFSLFLFTFFFLLLGHLDIHLSPVHDLVVSEVQIGDYVEEDDIVRYEDDHGREEGKIKEND